MNAYISKYWERVHSSFWFLPTVMVVFAVALSFVSVAYDEPVRDWLTQTFGWTFRGGADGASSVLGAVAGSMITLAGVVFSMTMVALSLASAQQGPRLLRNFMRDTTTQFVLGTFVSTFLYCLMVLRTIRRAADDAFVPHLSVALGVGFAVLSVGVVIYFIHHVSVTIQVNESVARVGREMIVEIDRLFPERCDEDEVTERVAAMDSEGQPIASKLDGYVQFVDFEALVDLAKAENIVLGLQRAAGDYVVAGCALAVLWPAAPMENALKIRINDAFVLGNQRTVGQDVGFGLSQLVEVAVRALSPGVNDPFTAIACLDHLGSALCRLATRRWPSPDRQDSEGKLRVIARFARFPDFVDVAFDQIRQYSRDSPAVMIRMLETIAVIAEFARRPADVAALRHHAGMIVRGARAALPEADDIRRVEDSYQRVMDRCGA